MADKKSTPKSVAKSYADKYEAPVDVDIEVEDIAEVEEVIDTPAEVEEVAEVEIVEVVEPEVAPKKSASKSVPPTTYAVVSGGAVDPVRLSKCVYKNMRSKRSLTVHHLQRRLKEWGFNEAYLDKDGFFGDHTLNAVNEFRSARGIEASVPMDAKTFSAIFEGDTNVTVVID